MGAVGRPVFLLLCLLLAACSGDSHCSSVTGGCESDDGIVWYCLSNSLGDIVTAHDEVVALLESLGGAPPANATLDVATGAYTITLPDGGLEGIISTADDLGDGFDLGEEATVTWSLEGQHFYGVATGSGSFTFVGSAAGFSVTGSGSTDDESGCDLDVASLSLTGSSSSNFGTGTLAFSCRSSGGTVVGTVTFDGSDTGDIAAQFRGEAVSWTFDLDTHTVAFGPS